MSSSSPSPQRQQDEQKTHQASNASMTQLPPSPEIKSALQPLMAPGEFSLHATADASIPSLSFSAPTRRLRSVARYQAFHPQALACSDVLTSSLNEEETVPSNSATRTTSKDPGPTSLGAVAGTHGVALFRLSRPHVPLLILSHATTTSNSNKSVSSMAFQPTLTTTASTGSTTPSTNPQSLYLAATRGSGVLIWDASGHSPNPLIGRLGMDQVNSQYGTTTTAEDARIVSIAWKPSTSTPLLGTVTSTSLSLWDLRSSSGANAVFKPNLRFGTARRVLETYVPLMQAAFSSESNECATLDSSGIVRIYDIRMADRARSYMGSPVSTFAAHVSAGVGIAYFPESSNKKDAASTTTNSRWLTWGLDSPNSSTVVKVWSKDVSKPVSTTPSSSDIDDYWTMSDSVSQGQHSKLSTATQTDYSLVAKCVRPNLAAARVGASPVENSFVAIGHVHDGANPDNRGWWAELYTVFQNTSDQQGTSTSDHPRTTHELKKVAGLQGGTSKNSGDTSALLSVLGSQLPLGSLTAAELGFSGSPVQPHSHLLEDTLADKQDDENRHVELLLCCMSDTGVVTTHVIPEAIPKPADNRGAETGRRGDMSPKRISAAVRTAFPASNQARVYPEDREGSSFLDAAGFWGGTSKQGADAAKNRMEEARYRLEHLQPVPSLLSPENDIPPTSLVAGRRDAEGGLMPFDMDVPVAYGSVATSGVKSNIQLGITDMASGTVVSSSGIGVVEESEAVATDVMDSTTMMENIETERVPCPRLCGAMFGMGAGGLVVFHNGEVKKMWNWYQRTDTLRLTGVLGGKADKPAAESDNFRGVKSTPRTSNPLSPRVEESAKQSQPDANSGPRTLKELVNMMRTAKEAQWGDHVVSDDSDSQADVSAGDNFFEEESDSNSSDSGDENPLTPPPGHEMYERYFGGRAWKGTIERAEVPGSPSRVPSSGGSPVTNTKFRSTYGPSSDMLAPVVSVSHELNNIVLNHQTIALATGWELGGWDVTSGMLQTDTLSPDEYEQPLETSSDGGKEASLMRMGLPHYRYLSMSSEKKASLPRPKSDPNLFQPVQSKTKHVHDPLDDPGVHGGEYTVRPNMEESMTFLKKLFTHQQEGGRTLSPLMSPPDSPSRFKSYPSEKRASSAGEMRSFKNKTKAFQNKEISLKDPRTGMARLGVYTLIDPRSDEKDEVVNNLENVKRICLHNATVCENLGASEKEGVWKLLAQTVDNQMDSGGKLFNGWGGKGGGALGVDLVANLLEYYEKLRDVQMLATICCVLSGGHRDPESQTQPHLLPQGPNVNAKYDAYIKKYAELLYSWGLLTVRAELNKHLLRVPPRREGDTSMEEKTETGRSPGIAVVFRCPTCGRDADFNTNICRTCQDFAFRCSICDNAIRGLFTVCDVCNHGGHVDHMKSWFSNHVECPTGCGCTCSLSPVMPAGEVAVEFE